MAKKSTLLTTSTANDVVLKDGKYFVGSIELSKNTVHKRFKAEVAQVVTIDTTAATSPAVSKEIGVTITVVQGNKEVVQRTVSFKTPATITEIGASAALQNEAVNASLVAQLNGLGFPFVAASLTGGEGITITDKAGYYKGTRGGVTGVNIFGFTATSLVITTKGVYGFGLGSDLLEKTAHFDPMLSQFIGGSNGIEIPSGIAAAQKYDALISEHGVVFIDNGKGSSTTNAAGFLAFEKAAHKVIALFNKSVHSVEEFFDGGFIGGAVGGGAVGGTETTSINTYVTPYGTLAQHIMGDTATVIYPVQGNTGWNIDNDNTATEGSEYTPPIATVNEQKFIVGKSAFQIYAKVLVGDATDVNLRVGFRKVQADQADFGYSDYAVVSLTADVVKTAANLNGGTPYTKTTTDVFADATYYDVQVIVKPDGTVYAAVNGKEYAVESASGVAMVFDATDVLIPTISAVNVGGGDADTVLNQLVANESTNWLD